MWGRVKVESNVSRSKSSTNQVEIPHRKFERVIWNSSPRLKWLKLSSWHKTTYKDCPWVLIGNRRLSYIFVGFFGESWWFDIMISYTTQYLRCFPKPYDPQPNIRNLPRKHQLNNPYLLVCDLKRETEKSKSTLNAFTSEWTVSRLCKLCIPVAIAITVSFHHTVYFESVSVVMFHFHVHQLS